MTSHKGVVATEPAIDANNVETNVDKNIENKIDGNVDTNVEVPVCQTTLTPLLGHDVDAMADDASSNLDEKKVVRQDNLPAVTFARQEQV